ncbi:4-carboxymuconolactone decarboxylase [Tessaracoccus bendigoensis DSM 12906]|uniref:4-carboxymuconolactone decarboxylase n=1 Tax=Tessaracoccus bendigoensis DSM 12906 TaxID=1123357 RepID=A0A1M6L2K9_9ACTN|nr:carboxymuconolactone decarboxylase family protein [Tessaracoccus bendigoensis]SHJ65495.1 4-carboxymuconolactone decarboxylase [Tessaracoccus bendigoensis DSM 12906]
MSQNQDSEITDPELVEYFGNFADGETIADATALAESLDARTRALVRLGATLAVGGLGQFRALASGAIQAGEIGPVELKEVVYQGVAYAGMARAHDFLLVVNEILTDAGVELPLPGQSGCTPETRFEYGKSVQARIVGGRDAVDKRIADAPADEAHFQRYLAENCFGDTVGRGGLDMSTRELVTFAMLAGLGGADNQVKGHVGANLAVGNTRAELLAVLTVLVPFIGYPRTLNALAALDAVTLA